MEQKSSRRAFFTQVGQIIGLAVVAPALFRSKAFAEEQRRRSRDAGNAAGGGADLSLPLVEPGKGAAAAVSYSFKKSDVKDAALKIARSGVPFEKQACSGCGFYTKVGMKDGQEVGKCQIFAGQLVKSTAWCSSWNKKA